MIPMSKTYGAASEADLNGLESIYNLVLPKAYREFLSKQNGGRPELRPFNVPGWGSSVVNTFYGVGIGGIYDLEMVREAFEGVIPEGVFAIADDPGGNQLCIGVEGEKRGKVYFWFHEAGDTDEEAAALFEVAPSFEAFLALCSSNQ